MPKPATFAEFMDWIDRLALSQAHQSDLLETGLSNALRLHPDFDRGQWFSEHGEGHLVNTYAMCAWLLIDDSAWQDFEDSAAEFEDGDD